MNTSTIYMYMNMHTFVNTCLYAYAHTIIEYSVGGNRGCCTCSNFQMWD